MCRSPWWLAVVAGAALFPFASAAAEHTDRFGETLPARNYRKILGLGRERCRHHVFVVLAHAGDHCRALLCALDACGQKRLVL